MQLGDNAAAIEDLDVCVAYLDAEEARMAEDAQYTAQIDADVLFSRYYRGIANMQAGGYEAAIADFTACVEDGVNAETARFWRLLQRGGRGGRYLPLVDGVVPYGAGGL